MCGSEEFNFDCEASRSLFLVKKLSQKKLILQNFSSNTILHLKKVCVLTYYDFLFGFELLREVFSLNYGKVSSLSSSPFRKRCSDCSGRRIIPTTKMEHRRKFYQLKIIFQTCGLPFVCATCTILFNSRITPSGTGVAHLHDGSGGGG